MVCGLVFFLGKDEQLLIEHLTDTEVRNGPGVHWVLGVVKRKEKRKVELLEPLDWIRIKDTLTGELRVEHGPQLASFQRQMREYMPAAHTKLLRNVDDVSQNFQRTANLHRNFGELSSNVCRKFVEMS